MNGILSKSVNFYVRRDFNVQVYHSGLPVSRSVFHLLHIGTVAILKEFKKRISKEMNENQFCFYLTFLIKWSKLSLIVLLI